MAIKITRGQLLTFIAEPTNYLGAVIVPGRIDLYLYYKHQDGTSHVDDAIAMQHQTDGAWMAEFDTGLVVGPSLFASLRAHNPPGAQDFNITIEANKANPLEAGI
jgi:hypothetical protein